MLGGVLDGDGGKPGGEVQLLEPGETGQGDHVPGEHVSWYNFDETHLHCFFHKLFFFNLKNFYLVSHCTNALQSFCSY